MPKITKKVEITVDIKGKECNTCRFELIGDVTFAACYLFDVHLEIIDDCVYRCRECIEAFGDAE